MTCGGTEIRCPACGNVFLLAYGATIKLSDLKCAACGQDLWGQAMHDAEGVPR